MAQELAQKREKVVFQIESVGETLKRLDSKLSKNEEDVNYLLNNETVQAWMKIYEDRRKDVASLYEIYKKSENNKESLAGSGGQSIINKNIFTEGALTNTGSFKEAGH